MWHGRENILRWVFAFVGLLEIEGVDWVECGVGDSPERLQKMSNTFYTVELNMEKKKERDKNQAAITDYDRDLEFLKSICYDGSSDLLGRISNARPLVPSGRASGPTHSLSDRTFDYPIGRHVTISPSLNIDQHFCAHIEPAFDGC